MDRLRWVVLLVMVVAGLVGSLIAVWHTGDWGGFWLNLGTELIGAGATYVVLELVIREPQRLEARKAPLQTRQQIS